MSRKNILTFAFTSILLTMFLFYIDEGYYNFNWMLKWSNWFAFLLYAVPLFGFQVLISYGLKKVFPKYPKSSLAIGAITGIILALVFVIMILSFP
jgi:hypothetical protein